MNELTADEAAALALLKRILHRLILGMDIPQWEICDMIEKFEAKDEKGMTEKEKMLYEALKDCAGALTEVLEQINNGDKFDTCSSDCLLAMLEDDLDKAKAVLKKAEGGTQ